MPTPAASGRVVACALLTVALGTALPSGSLLLAGPTREVRSPDPLPSWHEGPARRALLEFIARVTDPVSPTRVPPAERIATFDQDGTLWVEHPLYAQAHFALDRLRELAARGPAWATEEPFRGLLAARDPGAAAARLGEADWLKLLAVTHADLTEEAFTHVVRTWLRRARHPRFHRPYTELVYQPMVELVKHLKDRRFKVYIVTGGGQDFVRAYAETVYGIPPEQVVGSSLAVRYAVRQGRPVIERQPSIDFVDDGAGKPVGIQRVIGRRPLLAFGNSSGDRQMLEWTTSAPGVRLGALLLHDDPRREYAYGPAAGLPDGSVGRFPPELQQQARRLGWTVVRMKRDWRRVFAWDQPAQ